MLSPTMTPQPGRLRSQGNPLVLGTYHRWKRDLNALAGNLDDEVSHQLGRIFGRPDPW
jgi:hypothetical protein